MSYVEEQQAYRDMAAQAASIFQEDGALQMVECWGGDVPDGKVTDFKRAVNATDDETVVLSWMVWPSNEVRDAANERMHEAARMQIQGDMRFDGQRMIYGGFRILLETDGATGR